MSLDWNSVTRQQLPAFSPLGLRDVLSSIHGDDRRPELGRSLESRFQAHRALLTDSGTSALAIALRLAASRRPNRPCVLPAYGCFDLITAALAAGVRVRLYDVDSTNLLPDFKSLGRALAGGAAALVVVHFFGLPVPMDQVREMASAADAAIVEDAAQAHGASWRGRPLGSFGDFSILSFGRGKGHSGGRGGALLMHGPSEGLTVLPEGTGSVREFGGLAAQWLFGRPRLFGIPARLPFLNIGETVFHRPAPVTGMSAGAAQVVLRTNSRATAEAEIRRATALRYIAAAAGHGAVIRPITESVPGWLRFPVRLGASPARRSAFRALGIARSYPCSLGRLPAAQAILEDAGPYAGADQLAEELWTWPTHSLLIEREILALEDLLRVL